MDTSAWFTGVRQNQLSEREVMLRNDRMSDPKLRQASDLTDDERNEASRKYYLSLAESQGMGAAEEKGMYMLLMT